MSARRRFRVYKAGSREILPLAEALRFQAEVGQRRWQQGLGGATQTAQPSPAPAEAAALRFLRPWTRCISSGPDHTGSSTTAILAPDRGGRPRLRLAGVISGAETGKMCLGVVWISICDVGVVRMDCPCQRPAQQGHTAHTAEIIRLVGQCCVLVLYWVGLYLLI